MNFLPNQIKMGENIKVVQEFFRCYAINDLEGMKQVMAHNIEWKIPGHHPLSGVKKGIDEVLAFFKKLQKASFKSDLLVLAENEEYVIDCHRGCGEYEANKVDMNWVFLYRIEHEKITQVQGFAGDQHAADAFFWAVYPMKPIQERISTN